MYEALRLYLFVIKEAESNSAGFQFDILSLLFQFVEVYQKVCILEWENFVPMKFKCDHYFSLFLSGVFNFPISNSFTVGALKSQISDLFMVHLLTSDFHNILKNKKFNKKFCCLS